MAWRGFAVLSRKGWGDSDKSGPGWTWAISPPPSLTRSFHGPVPPANSLGRPRVPVGQALPRESDLPLERLWLLPPAFCSPGTPGSSPGLPVQPPGLSRSQEEPRADSSRLLSSSRHGVLAAAREAQGVPPSARCLQGGAPLVSPLPHRALTAAPRLVGNTGRPGCRNHPTSLRALQCHLPCM